MFVPEKINAQVKKSFKKRIKKCLLSESCLVK